MFSTFKKFSWHIADSLCCLSFCLYSTVTSCTHSRTLRSFSHTGPYRALSWVPWHHCFLFIFNWKPSFQFSNLITTHKQRSSSTDTYTFFSCHDTWLVGSELPSQGLNPDGGSESTLSQPLDHQWSLQSCRLCSHNTPVFTSIPPAIQFGLSLPFNQTSLKQFWLPTDRLS